MPNKRFSDVSPKFGDQDSSKPGMKSDSRGIANPGAGSFKPNGGKVTNQGPSGKGGKDLPSPKFEEKKNRSDEACGELP